VSCLLLLTHHLHFLLYIPTLLLVVTLRYRAQGRLSAAFGIQMAAATVLIGVLFWLLAFHGSAPVPIDQFVTALKSRAADSRHLITPGIATMWYSEISEEMAATWSTMLNNARRIPIFVVLIALHAPLIDYFSRLVRSLVSDVDRMIVIAGLVAATCGYLIIGAVVFDYSRWVSNWAVCVILIMHAVKLLPSSDPQQLPIDPERKVNLALGWMITFIPRVGTTKPF
jgi:hypothetical protein